MAYVDSTNATGNGDTPSVAVPTGVAAGDIVIIACAIDVQGAVFDTGDWPSGFTELSETDITADGHSAAVGWKRLTGADGGSYTFGALGASADWVCQAFAFSGRHASNPPVVSTVNVQNTGQSSPITVSANGVTAVDGDDLLWVSAPDVTSSGAGNGHTAPASYTEREDAENLWANLSGATRENVSAGATGTVSGTFALSQDTAGWAAWLIRIPLADAGPPGGYILLENGTDRILLEDSSGLLILEETEASGDTFFITPSGSITPAGALIKQDQKTFTGSTTPAGSLLKQDQKTLSGSTTPAGALLKSLARTLGGSITPAGALTVIKAVLRTFTGSITPSGSLLKQDQKLVSGTVTPAGTLTKRDQKTFAGTVTPASTLSNIKAILRTFTASITPSGAMIRQTGKALSGSTAPTGSLIKSIAKRLTASITSSGAVAVTKVILRTFTGTVTSAGTLARAVSKSLTGSITPQGSAFKSIGKLFAGILTLAGNVINFVAGAPLPKTTLTVSGTVVTSTTLTDAAVTKAALNDSAVTACNVSDEIGG